MVALRECDATDGPLPGQHNWWRGDPLDHYLDEARAALATIADEVDVPLATEVLDAAVASTWPGPPVWFHGDIAFGNLLVRDGRLAAVIDFGTSGIGDPACDVVLAWTLLSGESRTVFRDALGLDDDTWARGRGWGLWKALITVAGSRDTDVAAADEARRVLQRDPGRPGVYSATVGGRARGGELTWSGARLHCNSPAGPCPRRPDPGERSRDPSSDHRARDGRGGRGDRARPASGSRCC